MTDRITGAALGLVSLLTAGAALADGHGHSHYHQHYAVQTPARTITVSCQRYISEQVIWDKPSGVFVQDLRNVGYTPSDALAIATTICRDERLVGDKAGLGNAMRSILRTNPPS